MSKKIIKGLWRFYLIWTLYMIAYVYMHYRDFTDADMIMYVASIAINVILLVRYNKIAD